MKKRISIPKQLLGRQSDTVEKRTAASKEEATEIFTIAKERLLNVNRWHEYCGIISATFQLIDPNGKIVDGTVKAGHYIRIDIPGPGTSAGNGYDWVYVEQLEQDTERLAIRVRPSAGPPINTGTAHFFDPAATSTFLVIQKDNTVWAEVHGRNEKPAVADSLADTVRNKLIGTIAAAGISLVQWKKLTKGLLQS